MELWIVIVRWSNIKCKILYLCDNILVFIHKFTAPYTIVKIHRAVSFWTLLTIMFSLCNISQSHFVGQHNFFKWFRNCSQNETTSWDLIEVVAFSTWLMCLWSGSSDVSQQQGFGFEPAGLLLPFCVDFSCSPCPCVRSLQVPRLPTLTHLVQTHVS